MKITIATPTFGKSHYLKECIDSVCDQSLTTLHIICGGNLSIDEKITEENVRVMNQEIDPGMVKCWGMAASLAETEYIGFLADDNSLQSGFSERMVSFLENYPACDLVFCNQYHMDSKGQIDLGKTKAFTIQFGRDLLPEGIIDERYYRIMLEKGAMPLEACIIRKNLWDLYGPFKTNARGAFDHEFLYRILLDKRKIGFIPEYLMNFRWHDASYSSKKKEDHIIGAIWAYESLMVNSNKYHDIFKMKSVFLKGRLLRYNIPSRDRINIIKTLIAEENGLKYIFKNSIIRILSRIKFWKE